jgi:hypothetical protein
MMDMQDVSHAEMDGQKCPTHGASAQTFVPAFALRLGPARFPTLAGAYMSNQLAETQFLCTLRHNWTSLDSTPPVITRWTCRVDLRASRAHLTVSVCCSATLHARHNLSHVLSVITSRGGSSPSLYSLTSQIYNGARAVGVS